MKYESSYHGLIQERTSFISDNSGKVLNKLEAELRTMEAEYILYGECSKTKPGPKYTVPALDLNKNIQMKKAEISLLKQRLEDAQFEITKLQELIDRESFNENAIKI
jgi:hypothetical protein